MWWTFGRSLDLFVGGQQSGAGGRLSGLGEWFGRVVWGLGFGVWDLDFSGLNIGLIRILVAVTQRDACKYQKTLLRNLNQQTPTQSARPHLAPPPALLRSSLRSCWPCWQNKGPEEGWGLGVGSWSAELGVWACCSAPHLAKHVAGDGRFLRRDA